MSNNISLSNSINLGGVIACSGFIPKETNI